MNFLLSKSNILIFLIQIILGFSIYAPTNINSEKAIEQMAEQEKAAFNQMFLMYQGNQSGSVVRSLITTIDTSNTNNERKLQLYLNDSQDNILDNIVATQKYNVYFHYDNDGYIDAAMIYNAE